MRRAREAGTLRMGTVDAFLHDRLGGRFATDLSTASRTQLLARRRARLGRQLLAAFGIEPRVAAADRPELRALGELRHERWPVALPLTAQLVDQQAALAGSGAVRPGELKATYGTGVFVLGRTDEPVTRERPAADGRVGGAATPPAAPARARPTRSTAACSRRARCSTGSRASSAWRADTPALLRGGGERAATARA